MKINIYQTVQVTDEQRVKLGAVLDGQVKPKRQATRDELKAYIWEHGQDWETRLSDDWREAFDANVPETDDEADEDLLGDLTQEEADDEFGDLI